MLNQKKSDNNQEDWNTIDTDLEDMHWRRQQHGEEGPARRELRTLRERSNPLVHFNDQEFQELIFKSRMSSPKM